MKPKRVVIIAGGVIKDYQYYKGFLGQEDYIICADSGVNHAKKLGHVPHLIVGDFDSAAPADLKFFQQLGSEVKTYPAEKNQTDTQIALEFALEKKPEEIIFLAATGSRLDHTWSNVLLLTSLLNHSIKATIIDEHHEISLVHHYIELEGQVGETISLLPLTSEVKGIKTQGLKYLVKDGFFSLSNPYGVSNQLIKPKAVIEVEEGLLLLIRIKNVENYLD